MANFEAAAAPRGKGRRRGDKIGSDYSSDKWRGDIEGAESSSSEDLRDLRNKLYSGGSAERRTVHASRMPTSLSRSSLSHSKSSSRHRSKSIHAHRSEVEPKPHHRSRRSSQDDRSAPAYVYESPKARARSATVRVTEKRPSRHYDSYSDSSTYDGVLSVVSEESKHEPRTRKVNDVHVRSKRPSSSRIKSEADGRMATKKDPKAASKSSRWSYISTARPTPALQPLKMLKRTLSVQESRPPRSTPRRSHSVANSSRPPKPPNEPAMTVTKHRKRSSSILGLGIWRSQPEKKSKPVRLVECLTCLSDDIPRDKSAKLQCGHYMCHPCLKRIFELSVKDPQHMPPKCCTSDHIPLKHVNRLFNNDFKKLWNKKQIEFTTKNRMYCPGKKCGEWINPKKHMHVDRDVKYAQCGSCDIKICCQCNGKWHGRKDCPKDEATNALLEAAKQAGWQRCYNCRTMVELKEGCNHMTCRCRAEFCMICGVKWKTCNCLWFNYDQVENDRLENMRVPRDILHDFQMPIPERFRPGQRPGRPRAYHGDAGHEIMAWMNGGALPDNFLREPVRVNEFPRLRNENNRGLAPHARRPEMLWEPRPRAAPPPPPPPPPPIGLPPPRNMESAARRANLDARPPPDWLLEMTLPRRPRRDVTAETASHVRPGPLLTPRPPSSPRRTSGPVMPPRRSELAGLQGRGRDRVGNWRAYVEPGVTPEEGLLST